MMRWIVIGAGAIGSYVAHELQGRGQRIIVDIAPEVREAWRRHNETALHPDELVDGFEWSSEDTALVATKASALSAALALIPDRVPTVVLCNGIGPDPGETLPPGACPGVVDFAVSADTPGEVRCTRTGSLTLPRGAPFDADQRLQEALQGSDIRVRLTEHMDAHRHGKLVLNCAFDPVAALTGTSFGGVLKARASRQLFLELLEEGLRAVRQEYPELPPVQGVSPTMLYRLLSVPLFGALIARIAAWQAKHVESAMLEDVRRGRPTEIDAQNGYLLKFAERHAIEVPTHARVVDAIKGLENGSRHPHPRAAEDLLHESQSHGRPLHG